MPSVSTFEMKPSETTTCSGIEPLTENKVPELDEIERIRDDLLWILKNFEVGIDAV